MRNICMDEFIMDHPRVCGEHADYPLHIDVISGSSPRMRGTQGRQQHGDSRRGIIPAYAGNTGCSMGCPRPFRDHPRVCGEHLVRFKTCAPSAGSSPRMRGTPKLVFRCHIIIGIIPAYAGNTNISPSILTILGDHPRVCGEHTKRL